MAEDGRRTDAQEHGRRIEKRKRTFVEALKDKYCEDEESCNNNNIVIIHIGRNRRRENSESSEEEAELAHLRTVGLAKSCIAHAGLPQKGLGSLCPNITELDLQKNLLTKWSETLTILSNLPLLKFVNLSENKLQNDQACLENLQFTLNFLEEMVLNLTAMSWDEVLSLTHISPALKELHLCHNGYSTVPSDNIEALGGIETLRLNNNNITSWSEIWKLRDLPKLQNLILSENPVEEVFYVQSEEPELFTADLPQSQHASDSELICSEIVDKIVNDFCQNYDISLSTCDNTIKNTGDNIPEAAEVIEGDHRPISENLSQNSINETTAISNISLNHAEMENSVNHSNAGQCLKNKNITSIPKVENDFKRKDSETNGPSLETEILEESSICVDLSGKSSVGGNEVATATPIISNVQEAVRITVFDSQQVSSVTFSLDANSTSETNKLLPTNHISSEVHEKSSNQSNAGYQDHMFHKSQSAPELRRPFPSLHTLCLSHTQLSDWKHLSAINEFPCLTAVRIKNISLGANLPSEDRRKLFLACLPSIKILNGGEVSLTEREKAERHFIRHFIQDDVKPECFQELVTKHGQLYPMEDIDLNRGFQEWVSVKFIYNGLEVLEDKIHVVETVGKLKQFIKRSLGKQLRIVNFKIWHLACGPFHTDADVQLEELFLPSLPLSRFDIQEGDEIHIEKVKFTDARPPRPAVLVKRDTECSVRK